MSSEDRPIEFISGTEERDISRKVMTWLNNWLDDNPDVPLSIDFIDYEFIDADTSSMTMSLIQSPYIAERFISGAYIAEYQFKIVYRTKPASPSARLSSDELLDSLGAWADGQKPDIGDRLEVQKLEQTTRSALFARMDGGWEDHQIFMRMTYKVTP